MGRDPRFPAPSGFSSSPLHRKERSDFPFSSSFSQRPIHCPLPLHHHLLSFLLVSSPTASLSAAHFFFPSHLQPSAVPPSSQLSPLFEIKPSSQPPHHHNSLLFPLIFSTRPSFLSFIRPPVAAAGSPNAGRIANIHTRQTRLQLFPHNDSSSPSTQATAPSPLRFPLPSQPPQTVPNSSASTKPHSCRRSPH